MVEKDPQMMSQNELLPGNEPLFSCYIFAVKTDSYAGNFEREMCAFMTGVVGECGVGDIVAGLFAQEYPGENSWEDKVMQVADDHGCHRPVTIDNESVMIFLNDYPTNEDISFLRKRALLFIMDPRITASGIRIKIKGCELIKYDVERHQSTLASYPSLEITDV